MERIICVPHIIYSITSIATVCEALPCDSIRCFAQNSTFVTNPCCDYAAGYGSSVCGAMGEQAVPLEASRCEVHLHSRGGGHEARGGCDTRTALRRQLPKGNAAWGSSQRTCAFCGVCLTPAVLFTLTGARRGAQGPEAHGVSAATADGGSTPQGAPGRGRQRNPRRLLRRLDLLRDARPPWHAAVPQRVLPKARAQVHTVLRPSALIFLMQHLDATS